MPKTEWGRKETAIWPKSQAVNTYLAIFAAILLAILFFFVGLRFVGTPLQRYYAPVYLRTAVLGSFSQAHRSQYRMLFMTGVERQPEPIMSTDAVLGKTREPHGVIIPLTLSPSAVERGYDVLFRGPVRSYVDEAIEKLKISSDIRNKRLCRLCVHGVNLNSQTIC